MSEFKSAFVFQAIAQQSVESRMGKENYSGKLNAVNIEINSEDINQHRQSFMVEEVIEKSANLVSSEVSEHGQVGQKKQQKESGPVEIQKAEGKGPQQEHGEFFQF